MKSAFYQYLIQQDNMFKNINTCLNFKMSFTVINFTILQRFTLAYMEQVRVTKSCGEMHIHYN